MVLRCDESAKQINELHGVHGPGTCRIENALPDAAFHCQATFAIDLQIFRLKTVRDFHFGILRNILARPDMEKESNMNRKDTGDISGCRFDLSWLFWHSFRTENGFAEKVLLWILMDFGCFIMFPIVCIRLLRYKKGGCMGLHYSTFSWHCMRWEQSIHCSCHSMSMVSSAASCQRQNTGSNFHATSMQTIKYS